MSLLEIEKIIGVVRLPVICSDNWQSRNKATTLSGEQKIRSVSLATAIR